jgi:hypothetical protein
MQILTEEIFRGKTFCVIIFQFSFTVPDSAPENITYKNISSGEIEISFLPPSHPNGIIQNYTIYLKRNNGNEERTINTTTLTQTIKGKRMNLMLGTYIYIDCMATKILA